MNVISSFLLYSVLMALALMGVVVWRIASTRYGHFCHPTRRVMDDAERPFRRLDGFVERSVPTPATQDAYDPEAQIPTVVMTSRRGGQS